MSDNARPIQDVRVWRGSFGSRLKDGAQTAAVRLVQAVIFFGGLFIAHRLLTFALVLMAQDASQIRQNANGAAGYLGQAIRAGYLPATDDKGNVPPKPKDVIVPGVFPAPPSPSPSPSPSPGKKK